MLQQVGTGQHVVVGASVLAVGALGAFGIVGAGDQGLLRPEHFDAKRVVIQPAGAAFPDGVRITEFVDMDVGLVERRGYQRFVPNDFGVPTQVTAFSPDANDDLEVVEFGSESRIRIGDPSITFTGQRRYELSYVLPEAQLSSGQLFLDVIGTDETFRTDRFEVVLDGLVLSDPSCDVGATGDVGGCEFEVAPDGNQTVVIEPLEPGEGITIGGTVESAVDDGEIDGPPVSDRNPSGFRPLGLALAGVGGVTALGLYRWFRRRGSNVVFGAGGAADAAMGDLGLPGRGDPVADVPTYRVPDDRLADLATIEFVPPRGIEPWHAQALLSETVDDDTVAAWFSEMIAREAILVDESGDDPVLRSGSGRARLSAVDQEHLDRLFRDGDVELGSYDSGFRTVWSRVRSEQRRQIDESGWWSTEVSTRWSGVPGAALIGFAWPFLLMAGLLVGGGSIAGGGAALGGALASPVAAVVLALLVVGVVAGLAYRSMLASRTATGSALTLRSESFRRFLDASEGKHVDWAWEQGLLREYSAWAVALGAADAWESAVASSNVGPDATTSLRAPLLLHTHAAAFSPTHTKPAPSGSSSGGFGGGGFGGGVGGGGGGGSSGSW